MYLVEARDLYQRYGGRDILKNINIQVERGEVFALIGPTGAGKTTLLRLFDLLDPPTSGRIYFDGIDVTESGRKKVEARRRMAFVLQKPIVFNRSVYENIAYGLKLRGIKKDSVRQRVEDILGTVGLSADKSRNARTLSGGEVQRVAIARAIVSQPELLLLDEPTANLDPISASKIEDLITTIRRQNNVTIVMATHDMSQGQRLADRVAVLLDGAIQQAGDWREVFSSPRSKEVARFVGAENILEGVIASNQDGVVTIDVGGGLIEAISDCGVGERVYAFIRPEDITLFLSRVSSSARNSFTGKITRIVSSGPLRRIEMDCGFPLTVLVTQRSTEEMELKEGKQVYAAFKATAIHVIKSEK